MGWYGGQLAPHNHTAATGDGGLLTNPAFVGVATETGSPASSTDLPTVQLAVALADLL